jgi:hypothetical protein
MEIRDRRGGFFWLNNEVIDDYAPKIGGSALLVYMVLCRYANNATGESRPSQGTLAAICELSARSIRRAVATLETHKMIEKEQLTTKGQWDRNVYYLLRINDSPKDINVLRTPEATEGHAVGQTVGHHSTMNKKETEVTRELQTLFPEGTGGDFIITTAVLGDIWGFYLATLKRNPKTYTFTDKRQQQGRARLRECIAKTGSAEAAAKMMKEAITIMAASDFHNANGFTDWEHVFRSAEKFEAWFTRKGKGNGNGARNPAGAVHDTHENTERYTNGAWIVADE